MSISKIRTIFYTIAKYLGDFSAIKRAITQGSFRPLVTRLFRRLYGRFSSRGFNLFK